jgi:hypothetical protein
MGLPPRSGFVQHLQQRAQQQTDVQAAQALQLARAKLFKTALKRTG